MHRRATAAVATAGGPRGREGAAANGADAAQRSIQLVRGGIRAGALGRTLAPEHVRVDFVGAEQVAPTRDDAAEVFRAVLPQLRQARE